MLSCALGPLSTCALVGDVHDVNVADVVFLLNDIIFLSFELCVRCHWSSTIVSFLHVNARSVEVAFRAPYMDRNLYWL